ncbi:MAG: RDD family protein [Propionicimonas sp.]
MSDQTWPPTPSEGNDDAATPQSPAEPAAPSYPSEPAVPPAAPSPVDPYGQSPAAGYQTPYPQQPADPYGQPAGGYGQPAADPYGQPPAAPYGQPADPYTPPPAYGQPPADPYTPPPAYGQPAGAYQTPPPGYPPAPVGGGGTLVDWPKRALGGLIDYVAPSIIISVLANLVSNASTTLGGLVSAVLGIGWWAYLGYKSGTTGVTFGRSIAKTKLVSEQTGQPIGVGNGIVRQLAHMIDALICYVGFLFPLWDSKRQTIADKIVKTVVIDNSADPNAGNYDWNIQR